MKAKSKQAMIREALVGVVDTVGRKRNGNIIVRRGFYYRHGMTPAALSQRVVNALNLAGIKVRVVDSYEQWTPFRGGQSVAQGSHFGVELEVDNG